MCLNQVDHMLRKKIRFLFVFLVRLPLFLLLVFVVFILLLH